VTAKASPNPDVLKWARDTCNLSVEDVAARMNKSPELIEQWESGTDAPTYVQLEKLAYELYRRPIAVFFLPVRPAVADIRQSFRTLPSAEISQLSPTIMKLLRRYQVMQLNLAELCHDRNPFRSYSLKSRALADAKSEKVLASHLRDELGIALESQLTWRCPSIAFGKWREVFESHGIFVFKDAFRNDEISGFCLYESTFPIIVINNSMTWTRQVFTLFHELAHLTFRVSGVDKVHDDFVEQLPISSRRVERFCNRLASIFLVPDSDFDKQISGLKLSEDAIYQLSVLYSVSREVILRKLFDRDIVSQAVYDKLSDKWIKEIRRARPKKPGGDYFNNQNAYLGPGYLNLVYGQYFAKRISEYQLADYLNMKVESAKSLESIVLHK